MTSMPRNVGRGDGPSRRWESWSWISMLALGAAALVLGWTGFAQYHAALGQPQSFWDALYLSLQLFVLNSGAVPGPVPWELEVARFAAPIVAAWAIVKAGMVLFGDRILALRLWCSRDHVVVCGLGSKGLRLVKNFRARGRRVVAIELDDENPAIDLCREQGAIVLVGDACEASLLARARAERADHVLAMCGDEGANVNIALQCHTLAARSRLRRKTTCFVHVVDLKLCNLLRQHHVFAETNDPFEVRLFNTYEASARMLFERQPLDRGPIAVGDPRSVHLVVVGFGQMGQSVLLQAAKRAHYANGKQLQATVVDRTAGEKKADFYCRYPRFDQVCDVAFLDAMADDPQVLAHIDRLAADPQRLTTVVICLDSDSRCLSYALTVARKLGQKPVPILVRMSDEAGLATLLEKSDGDARLPITSFGATTHCCTQEFLLNDNLDTLARQIHENFKRTQLAKGRPLSDLSMRPWEELNEDFKDSNRQQADHIPVKLHTIGCHSAPIGTPGVVVDEFADEEVELLARMEHARWCAERYLADWTYAPGPKDVQARTHPCLVAWEQLSKDIQDYDREAVREIPQLLGRIGQAVYRTSSLASPSA